MEILAGIPEQETHQYDLFYQDEFIKLVRYKHENIIVNACSNTVSTDEIYSRYNPDWKHSWIACLNKIWPQGAINVLHLHGHTALVGTALMEAVKEHSPRAAIAFTYHVVETCPKGSLVYFNKKNCSVRPSVSTCAKCVLATRLGISETTTRVLFPFFPNFTFSEKMPALLKTKYLVGLSIDSFERFSPLIDRWFVFSEQCRSSLQRFGIAGTKTTLIRHGINKLYLSDGNKNERSTGDKTRFVYVGRFEKIKGIYTLLEAWSKLEISDERELFLIGGSSNMEPALQSLVNKVKKRKDVFLPGVLPQSEIKKILEKSHCLIIPSEVSETGPYVFHEAIACGTNVLASDIGGGAELAQFYGAGCQLFRMKDSADLINKIKQFQYTPPTGAPFAEEHHFNSILKVYKKFNPTLTIKI